MTHLFRKMVLGRCIIVAVFAFATGIAAAEGAGTNSTTGAVTKAKSNLFWWPEQLDLSPLRDHDARSNPLGENFSYKQAFSTLDFDQLKKDINAVMTDSKSWWPADWGNYGPFFIRMTWHAAGTYRTLDGRGGAGGG